MSSSLDLNDLLGMPSSVTPTSTSTPTPNNGYSPSQDQPNYSPVPSPPPQGCTPTTVGCIPTIAKSCQPNTTWGGLCLFQSYSTNICYYVSNADADNQTPIQAIRHYNGDPVVVSPTTPVTDANQIPTTIPPPTNGAYYLYYVYGNNVQGINQYNLGFSSVRPTDITPGTRAGVTVLTELQVFFPSGAAYNSHESIYQGLLVDDKQTPFYYGSIPTSYFYGTLI